MRYCTSCGHELGVGRFCTSCGQPIEWRTDTAERPTVPPPPHAPPPARFPLYADTEPPSEPRRTGAWVTWLAVAVVLTLVAGIGFWLLTRGDDETDAGATPSTPSASQDTSDEQSESTVPVPQPGELAPRAEVDVPATDPPGQDVSGNPVSFAGTNMLDGVPDTCWRMPGDGTGDELVVTLPTETRLRSVGMINGYAKTAQDAQGRELDWYHGNRRVLSVEWVFDDGTTVVQDFDDDPEMQSVDVDVTTTTITVRLLEVSPPGDGPARRDYTAISELSFVGR